MKESEKVLYQEFNNLESADDFSVDQFAQMNPQTLNQLVGTFMPIIKLKAENSYLVGTEAKQITVIGENCMVRVGGGFVTI